MVDVATSPVSFPGHQVTVTGFLARPPDAKPKPAVIVIHEWWGLNDHIKDIVQRLTREGYVAVAPDLYSCLGHPVTKDPAEAAKLMERLPSQQALKDLNATASYLKTLPFVDPLKFGVIGFCMGGTFALMMAAHNSDLKAAVPFYGQIPPTDSLKYLICPILFLHGAQDTWITKREADRLAQGLTQHAKPGQVVSYPNAGHAFFNNTRPDAYRPAEAADAWQRALTFLRQQVGV